MNHDSVEKSFGISYGQRNWHINKLNLPVAGLISSAKFMLRYFMGKNFNAISLKTFDVSAKTQMWSNGMLLNALNCSCEISFWCLSLNTVAPGFLTLSGIVVLPRGTFNSSGLRFKFSPWLDEWDEQLNSLSSDVKMSLSVSISMFLITVISSSVLESNANLSRFARLAAGALSAILSIYRMICNQKMSNYTEMVELRIVKPNSIFIILLKFQKCFKYSLYSLFHFYLCYWIFFAERLNRCHRKLIEPHKANSFEILSMKNKPHQFNTRFIN